MVTVELLKNVHKTYEGEVERKQSRMVKGYKLQRQNIALAAHAEERRDQSYNYGYS